MKVVAASPNKACDGREEEGKGEGRKSIGETRNGERKRTGGKSRAQT